MKAFPFYKQMDAMDCGPSCLRMIAKYHGRHYALQTLREKSYLTREGVSLLGISDAAESIGFRTVGVKISFDQLKNDAPLPCIVHWDQNHFIVVYKIKNDDVYVADPNKGLVKFVKEEFQKHWIGTRSNKQGVGLCLLLEPTPDFFKSEGEQKKQKPFTYLLSFLKPYRKYLVQLLFGLFAGSILQLIFPFLTQAVVDIGINNQDLSFITLVLVAQLVVFISESVIQVIRSWILLHLSTRINVSLISAFLMKLMKLSLGFFDTKHVGDLLQRINDHRRIERFLSEALLSTLFSVLNLIVFALVLAIYSWKILLLFVVGTLLYITWISFFMNRRKRIDYERFEKRAKNQGKIIELINGIQEIKLNNSERQKRWEWEAIQADLFKVNMKSLAINQSQVHGASFIIRVVNILITFIAANAVVGGDITLGAMVAISFIIGQLTGEVGEFIFFMQMKQDAEISLERMQDIQNLKEEDEDSLNELLSDEGDRDVRLKDVSFQYEGPRSPFVVKDVDVVFPTGKVTAIVGVSGSGKTTLLKMILGFYQPVKGEILIGSQKLSTISGGGWREQCGVVMQDGFIFSDTIARNVAVGVDHVDKQRLFKACEMANIGSFIESLPLSYNTLIGQEGVGLSQGQKQRILIARAIYKNPKFLLFDEATNALDAKNEKDVMENLNRFYDGRTVIVVAHRLSTVKNADQILVLDEGVLVEKGNHAELIKKQGAYYSLVKDQLELGQ